ncbi:hypothetical protein PCA31118_00158 [Pandoraea captiosa]|uniref:Uncharacterized protein n=1 Tax=Pandoraea captiosa TaxID=2508302 RepID=A0A5E4ZH59_9BURK|nr:hypothetical protein PCA31118_00158 [Pandoraea captiosa]
MGNGLFARDDGEARTRPPSAADAAEAYRQQIGKCLPAG